MKRIFIATGVICFFLVLGTIQTSTAQNRMGVIPIFSDEESCPPCPLCPPIGIPATGQSTSYFTRDDGELQMGVAWPIPRFWDNLDGTVTDNLTNLIWLKNANCFGYQHWEGAHAYANSLESGECGLSDSSVPHDWRLPNIRELHSLIDFSNYNPALPTNHPFTATVENVRYWTSTTRPYPSDSSAWRVDIGSGELSYYLKGNTSPVWPVRGLE